MSARGPEDARAEVQALSALAAQAGIAEHWTDARRQPRRVAPDTLRAILAALELPAGSPRQIRDSRRRLAAEDARSLPPLLVARAGGMVEVPGPAGRYRIRCESGRAEEGALRPDEALRVPDEPGYHALSTPAGETTLAVAPPRAPALDMLAGAAARCWGLSAQVYSLRHAPPGDPGGTQGYGHFGALRALAEAAAAQGADVLAISPVHAMFAAEPGRDSPYSPSSRLFLNTLYAEPGCVLGGSALRAAMAGLPDGALSSLRALEAGELIDWETAGRWRQQLLRALHRRFVDAAPAVLRQRYRRYREAQGRPLRDHAVFEALHAAQRDGGGSPLPWTQWPQALRDPGSAAVGEYAAAHAREVDFHEFTQWLAADSLERAQRAARGAGMRIGLLADLAVGDSPDGSMAWGRQAELLRGLSIGAPPDLHNTLGQNWGLTAFSPRALRLGGYAAFLAMLRASLAHAGGVRIDHILGMARLWLIPEGAAAREGAYLRLPLDTLLNLVALEAWRRRAIAIGENLGTVPEGFDERLADHGLLGMDVLWFMRGPPSAPGAPAPFLPPPRWPAGAAAMSTTHDLPTLRGWWAGRDIDWRARLGLLGESDDETALRAERAQDRALLWRAAAAGAAGGPPEAVPDDTLLRYVSASPCPLVLLPMEDLAGMLEQPNLPGTVARHPNWRRRLPQQACECFASPDNLRRLDAVRQGRDARPPPRPAAGADTAVRGRRPPP